MNQGRNCVLCVDPWRPAMSPARKRIVVLGAMAPGRAAQAQATACGFAGAAPR
jgi:hypothetical protein